ACITNPATWEGGRQYSAAGDAGLVTCTLAMKLVRSCVHPISRTAPSGMKRGDWWAVRVLNPGLLGVREALLSRTGLLAGFDLDGSASLCPSTAVQRLCDWAHQGYSGGLKALWDGHDQDRRPLASRGDAATRPRT